MERNTKNARPKFIESQGNQLKHTKAKTNDEMDENKLNSALKSVPNYIGTFALDELDNLRISRLPCFLVVNLDKRRNPGTHWIAIAIYHNDVYVCDSLGTLLPSSSFPTGLINFLHLISFKKSLHITKQLQNEFSDTCGFYSAVFVHEMAKYNSYERFLKCFSSDYFVNDIFVRLLFNVLFCK